MSSTLFDQFAIRYDISVADKVAKNVADIHVCVIIE